MVMYNLPKTKTYIYNFILIVFQNISNIPRDNFDCAPCNDLRLSLTIIMDSGDQYFRKKLSPKIFIIPHVRF